MTARKTLSPRARTIAVAFGIVVALGLSATPARTPPDRPLGRGDAAAVAAAPSPRPLRVYVASPLGFSEAGRAFYEGRLLPEVRRLGFEALDPWTLTDQARIDRVLAMPYGPARKEAWRALDAEIGANNRAAIDRADMVLAVLDGTDVDSGTAAEIGYAAGRGKPVVGYRGDFRLSADNDGSTVNLQVEHFIRAGGGDIVFRLEDVGPAMERVREALAAR